jgi:small ligand-binding sensory domain FIST
MPLKFASGVSNSMVLEEALATVFAQVEEGLEGERPDLAVLFTTAAYADRCTDISEEISDRLAPRHLIGCTGGSIIGRDQEYEDQAAISLLAACLPNTNISSFYLTAQNMAGLGRADLAAQVLGVDPSEDPAFILLPDPFSIESQGFLNTLEKVYPGSVKLGGLASAGMHPGTNRLYHGTDTHLEGVVGIAFKGPLEVAPIVSQGCRPIGDPLLVTRAESNLIHTLGNRPALEVLQQVVADLDEEDRALAQTALLTGVVIDEYKGDFDRGDFLIRNLLGADPGTGVLAINDRVATGQTIQFQVRDAATAEEDLEMLLEKNLLNLKGRKPLGALVFSCNGRGMHLFAKRNHDLEMIHQTFGKIPTAGFFCAGEIGPIGGRTFIHGFTSSIGLFLPPRPDGAAAP